MLHFINGDMFDTPVDIRINTVNCVGVMGAGVALAFKTRYPAMFREYKKVCEAGGLKPGTLNVWHTLTEWIINFPTKRHWRENSKYEDIEDGLKALRQYLNSVGRPVRVALPALGCGHGGLDWSRVSKLIEHYLGTVEAEIFVFEPADSVRAGELAAPQQRRSGNSEKELKPQILFEHERAFPTALRAMGFNELAIIGDSARLTEPMVLVMVSESPNAKEEEAAQQCVEALARTHTQLCLIDSPVCRRLTKLSVSRGTDVLLWSIEPIRVDTLQLRKELKAGRITVASVTSNNDALSQQARERTRQAAAKVSRALLITDSRPEWLSEAAVLNHQRLFFVRYASSGGEVDSLLRLGARPIGRNSESKTPNIAPIVASVRPYSADDAVTAGS